MNKLKAYRLPLLLILCGVMCMTVSNFLVNTASVNDPYAVDFENSRLSANGDINDGGTLSTVTDWRVLTEYHQNRLKSFLQQVKGVGDVSVLVYCDRSSVLSLADNHSADVSTIHELDGKGGERVTENSKKQSNYLILQDQYGNQRVVALSETVPAITAVCVVCTGGNQASVQERVIQTISTLYHLPPSNIVVVQGA